MQIRQVPTNPHPNASIRDVQRDIFRANQRQQQQRRPGVNLSEMSYQNKKMLIRRQLLLMLHARMCSCEDLIFQRENPNLPRPRCDMPHCTLLKTVLTHMKGCTRGRECTVTHCSSSRQILSHWKNCVNQACPVCPARLKPTNYGIVPTSTTTTTTTTNERPNGQQSVQPIQRGNLPFFSRNLNRFKSILHSEIHLLSTTHTAEEVGEIPMVSSTTGEVVHVEE